MFVIDNGFNGFDLFGLTDCEWHSRMLSEATMPGLPRKAAFGEHGSLVVGGGHNDVIHIFSARTGEVIDKLHHRNWGFVQTVTVSYSYAH